VSVVWITGLPSSGKSTLAVRLRDRLRETRRCAVVLDGDEVREILGAHDYTASARDVFYRSLAGLAAMIANQGTVAIVAATAPSRSHRAVARQYAPRFIEVYVDTPFAECARRDTKGLYAAARQGDVATLPGAGADYEPPTTPDMIAHGGDDALAIDAIAKSLES
jgi:adenylylsulfate kinase